MIQGKSVLSTKSLDFAVRIVGLSRCLRKRRQELSICDQVLRSGTSVGANVREAESAQSRADFVAKMSIALKECGETGFWLDLLRRVSGITDSEYDSIDADRRELFALLTSIIKTAKSKMA